MIALPRSIEVLVVDDSAVQREFLCYLLSADPQLHVAGTAQDGIDAIERAAALRPDVIVLDVNMPRMNGFEAARRILIETPTPIVMTSASVVDHEMELSFAALEAGALAIVAKPRGLDDPEHDAEAHRLITTVKLMSEITVVRRWPERKRVERLSNPTQGREQRARVVAIAASTGGPSAITDILTRSSAGLSAAVLVVQHMAPGFMSGFADWLAQRTGLSVKLAEAGEPIIPRRVYLAPDGSQMGVSSEERIALYPGMMMNGFCPSGSYLLESVAKRYGPAAIGIVLTGMGNDGAEGLLRLRQAGGLAIAQDAESCAVFGMPQEAISLGAAEYVLPPAAIASIVGAAAKHG